MALVQDSFGDLWGASLCFADADEAFASTGAFSTVAGSHAAMAAAAAAAAKSRARGRGDQRAARHFEGLATQLLATPSEAAHQVEEVVAPLELETRPSLAGLELTTQDILHYQASLDRDAAWLWCHGCHHEALAGNRAAACASSSTAIAPAPPEAACQWCHREGLAGNNSTAALVCSSSAAAAIAEAETAVGAICEAETALGVLCEEAAGVRTALRALASYQSSSRGTLDGKAGSTSCGLPAQQDCPSSPQPRETPQRAAMVVPRTPHYPLHVETPAASLVEQALQEVLPAPEVLIALQETCERPQAKPPPPVPPEMLACSLGGVDDLTQFYEAMPGAQADLRARVAEAAAEAAATAEPGICMGEADRNAGHHNADNAEAISEGELQTLPYEVRSMAGFANAAAPAVGAGAGAAGASYGAMVAAAAEVDDAEVMTLQYEGLLAPRMPLTSTAACEAEAATLPWYEGPLAFEPSSLVLQEEVSNAAPAPLARGGLGRKPTAAAASARPSDRRGGQAAAASAAAAIAATASRLAQEPQWLVPAAKRRRLQAPPHHGATASAAAVTCGAAAVVSHFGGLGSRARSLASMPWPRRQLTLFEALVRRGTAD